MASSSSSSRRMKIYEDIEKVQALINEEKVNLFDYYVSQGTIPKSPNLVRLERDLQVMRDELSNVGETREEIRRGKQPETSSGPQVKIPDNAYSFEIGVKEAAVFDKLVGSPQHQLGFEGDKSLIDQTALENEYVDLQALPRSIFVRTWVDRPDLFQALVLGPEESLYEDAIFVFDIKLPSRYPYKPPVVRFSYPHVQIGGCLNPSGGLLERAFVEKAWNFRIADLLINIQSGDEFFSRDPDSSRNQLSRVWAIMYETLRFPSPHFAAEIQKHFLNRFPRINEGMKAERNKLKGKENKKKRRDIDDFRNWILDLIVRDKSEKVENLSRIESMKKKVMGVLKIG